MSEPQTDQSKSPVEAALEQAVDTFVYAPIGLVFEGASLLPQLVEKGRTQVTVARMLGQLAVQQGRQEATKAAGKLQDQAAGLLDLIGGSLAPGATDGDTSAPTPPPPARPTRTARRAPGAARDAARAVAGTTRAASPTAPSAPAAEPAPTIDPTSLAIPDYDGLSASHVVNRLAGLAPAELEAVRRYEAANRGRKTILSKVAQLQSA